METKTDIQYYIQHKMPIKNILSIKIYWPAIVVNSEISLFQSSVICGWSLHTTPEKNIECKHSHSLSYLSASHTAVLPKVTLVRRLICNHSWSDSEYQNPQIMTHPTGHSDGQHSVWGSLLRDDTDLRHCSAFRWQDQSTCYVHTVWNMTPLHLPHFPRLNTPYALLLLT